jgi:hypothetical protein
MAVTAGMGESAISRLANNGGYKELAQLTDGYTYKAPDGTKTNIGGLFDKSNNRFVSQGTETMWRRAIGGQSGAVNSKIPYAIHGAGLGAAEVANAAGISQVHSGAANTFAEAAFGGYVDATHQEATPAERVVAQQDAANNAVRQLIEITKSSQYAGSTDRAVAAAMKAEAVKALSDGRLDPGMKVEVDDTEMSVHEYLDTHITKDGAITVNQKQTNIK